MHNPHYACLAHQDERHDEYSLIPLRPGDIISIKDWRNAQIDILRQTAPLSDEDQLNYFHQIVVPTYSQQYPEMVLFSFLQDNQLIGYGGLVHINWPARRAEVSFLVEPSRRAATPIYQSDFQAFFSMIKSIAFDQLQLHRLTTETFAFRQRTIRLLEEHGFQREGRLRQHIFHNDCYVDSLVHGCLRTPSHDTQCNVLVTSIGKKTPLLKAVRQALDKLGRSSMLHGGDHDRQCLGQFFVDCFWAMKSDGELTEQDIVDYCRHHQIKAIIPTRDAELPFFARIAPLLGQYGIKVMTSSEQAVMACIDKIVFSGIAAELRDIKVVQTDTDINQLQADRLVVKERYGAGSKNIGLNLTREEALLHATTLSNPVFQPFIPGIEYSIDLYMDMQGLCRGVVARTRDMVVNGESQVSTTVHHQHLEEQCTILAQHLGLRGHLVFQAIEDLQGEAHFIECNCRFGGASTLAIAVGLDSFYWFLLECIDRKTATGIWKPPSGEVRLVRSAVDHFFEVS